jgi:hypothetical protein
MMRRSVLGHGLYDCLAWGSTYEEALANLRESGIPSLEQGAGGWYLGLTRPGVTIPVGDETAAHLKAFTDCLGLDPAKRVGRRKVPEIEVQVFEDAPVGSEVRCVCVILVH